MVGPQNDGPQWRNFPGMTHADVEFSTSIGVGSLADHAGKKVIVNPNAMILMEFTD